MRRAVVARSAVVLTVLAVIGGVVAASVAGAGATDAPPPTQAHHPRSAPTAAGAAAAAASPSHVEVTCRSRNARSARADLAALAARAGALGRGRATATAAGSTVTASVPGAAAVDAGALCGTGPLEVRPLVTPLEPVRVPAPGGDQLGAIGEALPTDDAGMRALPRAGQLALLTALQNSTCPVGAPDPAGGPLLGCRGGPGPHDRSAGLFGPRQVTADDIAAVSVTPTPDDFPGDAPAWGVRITPARSGPGLALLDYARAHDAGPGAPDAQLSCGSAEQPCGNDLGLLAGNRLLLLFAAHVDPDPTTGEATIVAGALFPTRSQAQDFVRSIDPALPVPLRSG